MLWITSSSTGSSWKRRSERTSDEMPVGTAKLDMDVPEELQGCAARLGSRSAGRTISGLTEKSFLGLKKRKAKFIVTAQMIRNFADVLFQKERGRNFQNLHYWYRSFCRRHKVVVRRVTSLRRKRYTPEELARIDVQWKGSVRKCKLRRNYATDLIIYMVEVPLYMDMFTGFTMAFQGDEQVEGNYTNSDKHRFTGVCAVSPLGRNSQCPPFSGC